MNKVEALAILGIEDKSDAKEAMRRLVKIHHPDHGGTAARFIEIMNAYRLVCNSAYRMNVERLSFGNPYKENVFQQKLLQGLRLQGAYCIKFVGNVFQKVGTPDIYIAHLQWAGWVELKTENEELRPHQAKAIRELNARGINALVARYRRRHGVILERVERKGVCIPVLLCKEWKDNFISDLVDYSSY